MSSVTKRAWKLQEFVAHGAPVNCLALGHKSGRVMVTGGEDKKVNMWAVGKPNCIMSLSGHTSPVESVRFGNAEEMVVAGSMSGALKIWDLEQAKIVRTLTGHKSSIRGLDFHPYGDYVASGSLDTNIKLWDIRRKGCIFTYKGHTNCVNTLRFSPDGRWIASGGEDNTLKIWDLTAGKLLTDLTLHTGAITCIEFHPNEFLLASGSADRTVKFWDLDAFQLVSSTDADSSAVNSIFFHPEGLCLYSGGNGMMKVFGWEPSRCFDTLALDWGRVADIAIAQNQLIGATYSQTNVSTFVVDIMRVAPCGNSPGSPGEHNLQALSPPISGRKSFCLERPPTQCTNRAENVMKEAPEEVSTPSEDPGDDAYSVADIKDQDDYREIFKPRHRLPRDPQCAVPTQNYVIHEPQRPPEVLSAAQPSIMEPFPAPPDEAPVVPTAKSVPPAKQDVPKSAPPVKPAPKPTPAPAPVAPAVQRPPVQPTPQAVLSPADNMEDFLPKKNMVALSGVATPHDMSETEAVSLIMKGHDSMTAVMSSRSKNLQIVRALYTGGNMKTAVDSAISMNDQAILVDLLNILNQRPSLWNLDLCSLLLPQIKELLGSKYEIYAQSACSGIKVVLRSFGTVIKSNISAPPSVGVDISREERYRKCKMCYGTLMEIRSLMESKNTIKGNLGNKLREIQLLMSSLD